MTKCYNDLIKLHTFQDRFDYLYIGGRVGRETFGVDRIFNQAFYSSYEWKQIRNRVIVRDRGCDLGMPGHEIVEDKIVIHHMNPILLPDIEECSDILLLEQYLICTKLSTHNEIHYGTRGHPVIPLTSRSKYDTCPWKR